MVEDKRRVNSLLGATVTVSTSGILDGCADTAQLGLRQEDPKIIDDTMFSNINRSTNGLDLFFQPIDFHRNQREVGLGTQNSICCDIRNKFLSSQH